VGDLGCGVVTYGVVMLLLWLLQLVLLVIWAIQWFSLVK
jgi:hypothetical protein